nr:T9SS type A sorting domain-containing protein [Bacteroidota bacterium]
MKKIFLSIALLCFTVLGYAVNLTWQVQNLAYSNLKVVDVRQNTNGIYALMKIDYAGTNFNNGDSDRIYIVRYNTSGGIISTFKYSYLQFAKQEPKTILLGNSGILYVLFTNTGTTGFKEYFVLKLNSTLTTELGLFSPNLGNVQREANFMRFADNNTSIILSTYKYLTNPTAYLAELTKIDLNGNQIWNYSINSGGSPSYIYDVKVKADRILACGMKSINGLKNIWAFSISNLGQPNFEFTTSASGYPNSALELESDNLNNVYLCGLKYDNAAFQYLWYMNKLDSAGNLIWAKTHTPNPPFGGLNYNIYPLHMAIDSQNNLYYLGGTGSYSSKTRLLKLNSAGSQIWARVFNKTTAFTEAAFDLKVSSSNKIYAATSQSNGSSNMHLYQFDTNGNKLDEDTCNVYPSKEMRLVGNSILVAGISKFGPIYVGALAKFDATPIREPNEMEGINAESTMSFYPNPASAEISVESSERISSWEIYNMIGKTVLKGLSDKDVNQERINISALPKGIYLLRVNNNSAQNLIIE